MEPMKKRCLFCGGDITVVINEPIDAIGKKLLREKEAMCQACARERKVEPEGNYFVYAGSMYQKVGNTHLKLWPVGAFH